MLILQENTSLENLQSMFVGNDVGSNYLGRYSVVRLPNTSFICRIWSRSSLHSGFCFMDESVELVQKRPNRSDTSIKSDRITFDNIEVIKSINLIKSLTIRVIFKDPWEKLKWTKKETALLNSLKDLLKLYTISENSTVHVHKLKEFDIFGIHCINILSIGIEGFGRVIRSTKVKILSKISLSSYEQLYLYNSNDIVVYYNEYQEIKKIINYRCRIIGDENKHSTAGVLLCLQQVLLIGPIGCGKYSLLKKVCYDNHIVMLTLESSELMNIKCEERKEYLLNKLKLAQALAEDTNSGLCMLVIKHIENVMSKSGKSVVFINNFLEEASIIPNVVIIATTDSPHSLDSSLRAANKFSIEIYLNIPNENDRCLLISQLYSGFGLSEKSCLEIARNTPGFVLSDLVLVMRRASKSIISLKIQNENEVMNVVKSCIKTVQPSSVRGAVGLIPPSDHFNIDCIGGLDDIKKKLVQCIVWPILHANSFARMNIPLPSGVLLYGPPGCAKTSLVRAVASSCKTTFLSVSAADLYSPYVGDAEKTITQLFQRARASAPTVLFIDEIDALVGSRQFREKGVQERVLSSFLTELDGIGFNKDTEHSLNDKYNPAVIIIAATNRPQIVDSALLRPGRLDKLIYVPPPDTEQRFDILKKITQNLRIHEKISLYSIAEKTENYSGADLINLCREAGLQAITVEGVDVDCINEDHFNYALSNLKPSLDSEQISWYSQFSFG